MADERAGCTTKGCRRQKARCGEEREHVPNTIQRVHRRCLLLLGPELHQLPSMGYEPTPEQIAQAEEKRLKRREKKLWKEKQHNPSDQTVPLFLSRPWISLNPPDQPHNRSVRVMTWNVRTSYISVHPSAVRSKYTLVATRPVSRSCVELMCIFTIKSQ